ncbi:hypothetical protein PR202_ga20988 [Eleusine coracana subsp. coracana]|uniref:Peptidase C14 caspase domain-containing protein n=1 Tax=Eleusine coracana subsp. coracana TaxID=191504 RepID=A0AAV5D071_ELECO|nr:hypothetical protein QOZ80_8AG0631000 [Eleusine coracana subsp. coracana]GJN03533.1 hypothetical protein PR202_ga20988 [Eleusine coracana subsp. coracana]
MEGQMTTQKRLATLVGCNYVGTEEPVLQGCINDALAMRDLLVTRFGFAPADVTVLTDDADDAAVRPTGVNIRRTLADMVARAAPGDVLFFHFSGHGTLIDPVKPYHQCGKGETIVPCDSNLITDVDFRKLVNNLPLGASFTMVSDSCHSGGLIDKEKEQIGPSAGLPASSCTPPSSSTRTSQARFIPCDTLVQHLSLTSGLDTSHHIADHLLKIFGTDASAKFHGNAPPPTTRPDEGILLSGCQKDELSEDVEAQGDTKAGGAFTTAVLDVLAAHPAPLSNREVVTRVRAKLAEKGFEQHPCLYCSDDNAEVPFLFQQVEKAMSKL